MGNVADIGDRPQDLAEPDGLRIPAHTRPLRGVIDMHIDHAGQAAQVAFIQPQAGRTADVVEQECRFAGLTDANDEILLNFRPVEQLDLAEEVRHELAVGGYGRVAAMPVIVVQPGIDDRLADGMTTVAAELTLLTKHIENRCCRRIGHRQATMKTADVSERRGFSDRRYSGVVRHTSVV